MKSLGAVLSFLLILLSSISFAQKLKRADRQIVANLKTHLTGLTAKPNEKQAAEYISKQFERSGLTPRGDSNSWYQQFEIYDGKHIGQAGYFNINNHHLTLFDDYFPFAFSASKPAEGSVAIALAEDGYPWFKDISDIVANPSESPAVINELVRKRALVAAEKGASALIVYNSSRTDLVFDSMDRSAAVNIPVIFLSKKAFRKYCRDESSTIDVKLNVEITDNIHNGLNVVGFADHHSDSTIVTTATIDNHANTAALIELARLSKSISPKNKNYLFVAVSPGQKGNSNLQHLNNTLGHELRLAQRTIQIDSIQSENAGARELLRVKQALDALKMHSQR